MKDDVLISRTVDLAILAAGHREVVVASTAEREALAVGFGLLEVRSFRAELEGRRWRADGAVVIGRVRGEIIQACVVTLQPVVQSIDEAIEVRFLPAADDRERGQDEVFIDAEEEDPPELVEGRTVDLGALAAEFFAIAIDPYPRAADADLAAVLPEGVNRVERDSPFAALAGLAAQKKPKAEQG